jgi:hypothetical protein
MEHSPTRNTEEIMTDDALYVLLAIGALCAALFVTYLLYLTARVAHDAISARLRQRRWSPKSDYVRELDRELALCRSEGPLSDRDFRPRLGDRVWLAHDAADPTRGGVVCEVQLVDLTGHLHLGVAPARVSRLP